MQVQPQLQGPGGAAPGLCLGPRLADGLAVDLLQLTQAGKRGRNQLRLLTVPLQRGDQASGAPIGLVQGVLERLGLLDQD